VNLLSVDLRSSASLRDGLLHKELLMKQVKQKSVDTLSHGAYRTDGRIANQAGGSSHKEPV
jgi:hypothetical protein